ncbi:CLUMA_CG018142, isoform A [Clunio marinus]|uniref:CLUMA_CG018142, isoform A n=1 Tax=Clunio marinus TaxID=568069 RepID=A0A1J1J0W1_9DIPT|nr:CLUMA_CG018142, isoform A [Clunio marinus]
MKKDFSLKLILLLGLVNAINGDSRTRVVCYYDTRSSSKTGLGKVMPVDIEPALSSCTHLVYGYAGLDATTFKIAPLRTNEELDKTNGLYKQITSLKTKYPNLKILLSVGGDADVDPENEKLFYEKYLALLESSTGKIAFTNSVILILQDYGFDGLDLAFQFPKMKPKKIRSSVGSVWHSFKKTIGVAGKPVDENSEQHKDQFTGLVVELKNSFRLEKYELSVTVLPNVNATLYLDVQSIKNYVDFITMAAFDVVTPIRNPKEADYPAPTLSVSDRNTEENVDAWAAFLVSGGLPSYRVVIGVPSYGRAWKIEADATVTGSPPVQADGPAPEGVQTRTAGLFSYTEMCDKILNTRNKDLKGEYAPLRKIADPTKRYGIYAFRLPDENGDYGMWVGYEDPESAGNKAAFVRGKGFGGIALFDLSLDDVKGACHGTKFPILERIKNKFN